MSASIFLNLSQLRVGKEIPGDARSLNFERISRQRARGAFHQKTCKRRQNPIRRFHRHETTSRDSLGRVTSGQCQFFAPQSSCANKLPRVARRLGEPRRTLHMWHLAVDARCRKKRRMHHGSQSLFRCFLVVLHDTRQQRSRIPMFRLFLIRHLLRFRIKVDVTVSCPRPESGTRR